MSWRGGQKRPGPDDEDEALEAYAPETATTDISRPAGFENKGESPQFMQLVRLFEDYEDADGRKKKHNSGFRRPLLDAFFKRWREDVGPDVYPVLRLMLPDRDNRRRTYYLKEQKLAKAYILALDLAKGSSAAHSLEHWKVPTTQDRAAGEFSTVAHTVIKDRSSVTTGTVTIDDVNNVLERLSNAGINVGSNGVKRTVGIEQSNIIKDCTLKMTALEQKWLVRIILRDLKISLGERAVFNAMHPDANEYFNTCSDLLRVSIKLFDPHFRLPKEDGVVRPGYVFRPNLCARPTRDFAGIVKSMGKFRKPDDPDVAPYAQEDPYHYAQDEFIIEEKLDGERIQLHKIGDSYHYFSRKAHDYTYLYGKDAIEGSGSLTPFIAETFFSDIVEVILDGEMLAFDPTTDKYIAFGTLKTFAKKTQFGPSDARPCFKVFDVVYIKGPRGSQCLLDVPLYERKKLLHRIFQPVKGVIELADTRKGRTAADISNYLKYILESRGEGLVIKNPDSRYILSGRVDSWVKVKPDYMDELGENIDAVVIGGYWGSGGRGGRHSSFLVGLREEGKEQVDGEDQYVSFAKVGSGFNAAAYEWIGKKISDKWYSPDARRFGTSKGQPRWFKTVTEYPDQYVNPSDSFVVSIKAAEIVQGTEYGAAFTLRFPRASAIKTQEGYDASDALTLEGCKALRGTGGKRKFGQDVGGKKKSRTGRTASKAHSISQGLHDVEVLNDLFDDLTFYVHTLPATALSTKGDLQKLIVQHGGRIMQRVPDEGPSRVVVASEYKEKKGVAIKKGGSTADIISPNWVLECIEDNELLPLTKRFYIRALSDTMNSETYNLDDGFESPSPTPELSSVKEASVEPEPVATQANDQEYRSDEEPPTTDEEGGSEGDEPETEDDDVDLTDEVPLPDGVRSGVSQLKIEESTKMELDPTSVTDAKPGMGAGQGALAYDSSKLFAPFVCYFDTSENASLNRLPESTKSKKLQAKADAALLEAQTLLIDNGGEATPNLLNPDLTHLIVHATVPDRYEILIRNTTEPRYRKIVTHDWVDASVEYGEGDVLLEQDFKP